ncbi:MAG TPA: radical SAM protein [Candidatus Deferrimicrobiaceae bacterium]|jgi:radical SAM superfamily enzyme YgiQ (UPF0313 family)
MKVLLVNPPVARRYVHGIDEPLGLEYLAASIGDRHPVEILDSFARRFDVRETVDRLVAAEAGLVGIGMVFTGAWRTALQICAGIKAIRPETITVLGGNTATFLADRLLERPEVDVVVRGEGDVTFPRLVDALAAGEAIEGIPGITCRKDGKPFSTGNAPLVADLDALPFPARDRLPLAELYPRSILGARGCAYGCPYCSSSAFWRRSFRVRSVENILAEIRSLLRREEKLSYFSFADDCFTLVPGRAEQICDALERAEVGALWGCTGRIETMSEKLIGRLHRAGCRHMFFGVESGSDSVLAGLGRRYSARDVFEVYRLCLRAGIRPFFSFIVGLPNETESDLEQTFALIRRLEGVESGIHMLTPFPGTPIGNRPSAYGLRVIPHDVEDLDINTRSFLSTELLSNGRIVEAFRRALGYSLRSGRRVPSPDICACRESEPA